MKIRRTTFAAATALCAPLALSPAGSAGTDYVFEDIANNLDGYSTFGMPVGGGGFGPSINNARQVAFEASLPSGVEGIYTGDDPVGDAVVDTTGDFVNVRAPEMNSNGTIAFGGETASGGRGAYKIDSGGTLTRVAEANTSGFDDIFGRPNINDAGTVVFNASFGDNEGFFTGDDMVADLVADTSGDFEDFGLRAGINNSGDFAFYGVVDDVGTNIYAGNDPATDLLVSDEGPVQFFSLRPASLNDNGNVGFVDDLDAGGLGVFIGTGTNPTMIADTSGPYDFLSGFDVAFNNNDEAAFLATLDAGGEGIFTGPDAVADKVIATGDTLFGSTVIDLDIGFGGLNDNGDIGFYYELADNRRGIALAIPAPATACVCLTTLAGLAARRRR